MHKIIVTDITVKQYRVVCLVKVEGNKYSDQNLADNLLKLMPNLANHKCKNNLGENFLQVMHNTSLPHLLEHMIIDIQSKSTQKALFGTTEWVDEQQGIAKIELSYEDDLHCLEAIKQAVEIINS